MNTQTQYGLLLEKQWSCVYVFAGGGIALNEVDNLFLAHHQSSGTSACFDVALDGESDDHIAHYKPVGQPIAIAPESTETR